MRLFLRRVKDEKRRMAMLKDIGVDDFQKLKITDEYKAKVQDLVDILKKDNPGSLDFVEELEKKIKDAGEEGRVCLMFLLMLPFARDNAFM